jgi:integrase
MPRRPGIWLRKGTAWWYSTINGEKVRLSEDKKEAERLFHELLSKKAEADAPEPAAIFGPTFKKLADDYLKATQEEKSDRVFEQQTRCLQLFSNYLPKKTLAKDLKPHMVAAWLKSKPTWGTSTKAGKRKTIKAVLNWAVKQGYLEENPLKKMPGGEALKRDRILSEEEKKKIHAFILPRSAEFADFLRALELTGARPFSEMAQVTAADIDFTAGTITLQRHKNRKKTGKPRVIFLVPELKKMLEARVLQYPEGALFRSRRGKTWYTGSSRKWFALIEEKLGFEAHAYAYRHTFITDALIRGVPVEVLAALVGNTPAVLHRNYAHVGKNQDALKAAALKAIG